MKRGREMLADHMALVLVARTFAALTLELAVERMVEEMLKLVDCSAADSSCRSSRCCLVEVDIEVTTAPVKG